MYVDPTGHFALTAVIIGAIIGVVVGAGVGFGVTAYVDYQDDGQVFNGSVTWYDYLGATVFGGIVGGAIGYNAPSIATFLGSTYSFSIPTISMSGGTLAMSSVAVSVTGAQIAADAAAVAGVIVLYANYKRKPVAPRNHSNSKKEAYQKAYYKGGKKEPIFHSHGKYGPHYHPALGKYRHWHYYFSILFWLFSDEE